MALWRVVANKDWNLLGSCGPRDMEAELYKTLKEESVESGPALVAMKGLSCTGKTSNASRIASFLRCSHLDLDDIIKGTQRTYDHLLLSMEPDLARDHLDDLSHRVLFQLAADQLQLGHDVVVDSPLSRPGALQQLQDMADSYGVPLILVECIVLDKSIWLDWLSERNIAISSLPSELILSQSFDLDQANDVPRLVMDTKLFYYGEVFPLIQLISMFKQKLRCDRKANDNESGREGRENMKPRRHFSHSHPLIFVPSRRGSNTEDSSSPSESDCRICLEPITGLMSSYDCPRCNFRAHESCVELPQYMNSPLHIHPLGLFVQSFDNSIQQESGTKTEDENTDELDDDNNNCVVCRGSNRGPVYRCWQCDGLFVHYSCAVELTAELQHPCHKEHPLKLETYDDLSEVNRFVCRACGHRGVKASYRCLECKLKLHVTCAVGLPLKVEFECAQRHPLVLAPSPKDNVYDEYFCDVCEEERHGDYWIYYCHDCEFHAHLHCVNPDIKAYDMAEAKNAIDELMYQNEWHDSSDHDDTDIFTTASTCSAILTTNN